MSFQSQDCRRIRNQGPRRPWPSYRECDPVNWAASIAPLAGALWQLGVAGWLRPKAAVCQTHWHGTEGRRCNPAALQACRRVQKKTCKNQEAAYRQYQSGGLGKTFAGAARQSLAGTGPQIMSCIPLHKPDAQAKAPGASLACPRLREKKQQCSFPA